MLGDANCINQEKEQYQKIKAQAIQKRAKSLFQKQKCSVIYYHKGEQR